MHHLLNARAGYTEKYVKPKNYVNKVSANWRKLFLGQLHEIIQFKRK